MASKKKVDKLKALSELQGAYGKILPPEIVEAVVKSKNYDVHSSSNILQEMINNIDNPFVQTKKKTPKKQQSAQNTPKKAIPPGPRLQPSASTNALPTKSKKAERIEQAIEEIRKGYKVLVILRGLPGCGKSHLARAILDASLGVGANEHHIFSTDDYFIQPRFGYVYDSSRLSDAHSWNHQRAFTAMSRGLSPVIIDNTNLQMWEMKPYAMMATDFGYIITILEPDTWWACNDKELARKNIHNVPKPKIREMLDRYEKNVTPQKLLLAYNLVYKIQKPPQFRLMPPVTTRRTPTANGFQFSFSVPKTEITKSKSFSTFNRQPSAESNNSNDAIETINLMDFTEAPTFSNISTSPCAVNPVDEILMCKLEDSGNVLKPALIKDGCIMPLNSTDIDNDNAWGITEQATQSWQITDDSKSVPKTFDIENAWGVNEQALHSWEIVTPLEDAPSQVLQQPPKESEVVKVESIDNFSNVDINDFKYLSGDNLQLPEGFKIVSTTNRYISEGLPVKPYQSVTKKLMLHKSCSTDDVEDVTIDNRDERAKLQELKDVFPAIPLSYLKELFDKCNKNFNWTVDLLLEDKNWDQIKFNENGAEEEEEETTSTVPPLEEPNSTMQESFWDYTEISNEKVFKRKEISEESIQLKKCLESKIDINKEHYSDHVLRVKQLKFGNVPDEAQASSSSNINDSSSDSDYEMEEDNPKNLVELTLGDALVEQLEIRFGQGESFLPQGFQPVVQVPATLARQLYMLHIESVCQQMEAQNSILEQLVKEDEDFARKLQSQEQQKSNPPPQEPSMNLSEIMEEQAVANVYRRETEQWKNMTADTLAARLTKQKLFDTFPAVDRDSLVEILHAYDNDYKKTVEDLCTSLGVQNLDVLPSAKEPPLSPSAINEMKELEAICEDFKEDKEAHSAEYYRDEANKRLRNRQLLYQKAQTYYQKGMTEVAIFYSELAKKETQHYDQANHIAATTYLSEHSQRLQKFDTIDLHYLYVKEAIPALDVFIDRNINLLQGSKKNVQELYVITGRGNNSEGGISRIKPAVIARLKKRQIRFVQSNPGLLKIKVGKYSAVTSSIP